MGKSETTIVEVEYGPTFRAGMDVLDLALDLLEVVPDYVGNKDELKARIDTLAEILQTSFRYFVEVPPPNGEPNAKG